MRREPETAIVVDHAAEDPALAVFTGELDIANVARVRAALDDLVGGSGTPSVVVDLCAYTFIASCTLAELLRAERVVTARGGEFEVRWAPGVVLRVLELTGVQEHFKLTRAS